jgi:acetyl-CoA decarbonylase/synthase complex subunit gamma
MSYLVPPGLYALGAPGSEDPVAVTANYKMSFDTLRSALYGRSAWILVLETFGINVWCAAGKGTFGTHELIRRIGETGLDRVVRHRTLLLPILGAPGVAAHEVAQQAGFTVRYAAIRARDLPEYLDNGMVTTEAMRAMTFTFRERLAVVPVEVMTALPATLAVAALLFLAGWGLRDASSGLSTAAAFLGAVVAGTVAAPLLLPWIPGPSFAVKGALAGLAWGPAWYVPAGGGSTLFAAAAGCLALSAVSSFFTLNFTGSTPFTSRSGVRKELRAALPAMAIALVCAAALFVWGTFL